MLLGSGVVFGAMALVVLSFMDIGAARDAFLSPSPQRIAKVDVGLAGLVDRPRMQREIIGERVAPLTTAPIVPPAPERTPHNTRVIVQLEVVEKLMRLADGVDYTFWTFGGSVPGSFIRVREGDEVEFHLANHPNNKLPHNIDLHAVTGPGGGAEASLVAPGQQVAFTFRALNPSLYVYHCATAPVPMHIANGMYGLILVEPFEGLPPVDHEFYFMQSEVYTTGAFGEAGLQSFAQDKAIREQPDYVLFNGAVGATTGDKAPVVKRGESVRLFVGNGGPNLVSSFHVIGEIFDRVYVEGGTRVNENVQTTLIPAGGSAIVEFACEAPGMLNLVDHSIFRVFNKGALAQIRVEGEEDHGVFSGEQEIRDYDPETAPFQRPTLVTPENHTGLIETPAAPDTPTTRSFDERLTHGRAVYQRNCMACHGNDGRGVAGTFPPLAQSDYLRNLDDHGIGIVLRGLQGPVTVNGQNYNSIMPPLQLSNDEIASVLTYIHNSWGNTGGEVTFENVAAVRDGSAH